MAKCFGSYRIIFRPFKNTDSYLAMFKMRCGVPNAYILHITMYKMYVSLCSYCTVRISISKTSYVPVKVLDISTLIVQ